MTSTVVSRVAGACDFIGAWRRSQKIGRHMEARVCSDEGRNLRFYRSVDEEAVRAARMPRRRFGSPESMSVCGRFSGDN